MRKTISTLAALLVAFSLSHEAINAQSVYFPEKQGAVIIYDVFGADGTHKGYSVDSVAAILGTFTQGMAAVVNNSFDTEGVNENGGSRAYISFRNGEVINDLKTTTEESRKELMIEAALDGLSEKEANTIREIAENMKVEGECRGIPSDLHVGQELPDYEVEITMVFKAKLSFTDRKVINRETLLTPAGSFDCYIVEETNTSRVMMTKDMKTTRTWWAKGVGKVKEETYDEEMNLTEVMLISSMRHM